MKVWLTTKTPHPWWYHYAFYWVQLAQSVLGVLSFGLLHADWTLSYSRWYAMRSFAGMRKIHGIRRKGP